MASKETRKTASASTASGTRDNKPKHPSTGSLVTAQLLDQLKNTAQRTSSTTAPAVEDPPIPANPPVPAPIPLPENPQSAIRNPQSEHPGGGHARVISITLTPYDLQLCERIRARFLETTLAPSRSEILKLALHALDLDDEGLIEALLAVRERDGRRRKLEPGQKAPAAHYPAVNPGPYAPPRPGR
jgi:hypothetical protein